MTYNLTDKEKRVVKWLVEENQAGRLGDDFLVMEPDAAILNYEGNTIPDLSLGILNSLVSAELFRRDFVDDLVWRYTFRSNAFDAVRTNFGAVEVKQSELANFAELVAESFSLDEIGTLCYDIGVDREDIAGDNKIEKAAALVHYAAQRMKLLRLVAAVISRRESFDWIKLLDFAPTDSKD